MMMVSGATAASITNTNNFIFDNTPETLTSDGVSVQYSRSGGSFNDFQWNSDGSFGSTVDASIDNTSASSVFRLQEEGATFTLSISTDANTVLDSLNFLGFDHAGGGMTGYELFLDGVSLTTGTLAQSPVSQGSDYADYDYTFASDTTGGTLSVVFSGYTGHTFLDNVGINLTSTTTTVPEPTTGALVSLATLSLLARRKR